jgi:hypothetical protein
MASHLPYGLHSLKDALIDGLWLAAIIATLFLARFVPPEYCDRVAPGAQTVVHCFDR